MTTRAVSIAQRRIRLGSGAFARPGFYTNVQQPLQRTTKLYAISVGLAIAAGWFEIMFDTQTFTIALCILLLGVGLPHGTLDINLLTEKFKLSMASVIGTIALYLACATAMLLGWLMYPAAALVIFLLISIFHFAEDWAGDSNSFFAIGSAAALLSLPAILHHDALAKLFTILTNSEAAANIADMLLLIAPAAFSTAIAGVIVNCKARAFDAWAMTGATLIGMLILPPLLGFTLFFCISHSPRHLAAELRQFTDSSSDMVKHIVIPLTLGAIGIAVIIFSLVPHNSLSSQAISTAFVTLSILTLPHMLVPKLLEIWAGRGCLVHERDNYDLSAKPILGRSIAHY